MVRKIEFTNADGSTRLPSSAIDSFIRHFLCEAVDFECISQVSYVDKSIHHYQWPSLCPQTGSTLLNEEFGRGLWRGEMMREYRFSNVLSGIEFRVRLASESYMKKLWIRELQLLFN